MERQYRIEIEGQEHIVSARRDGEQIVVEHAGSSYVITPLAEARPDRSPDRPPPTATSAPRQSSPLAPPSAGATTPPASGHGVVTAPMAGVIRTLLVEVGARVKQGEGVVVMEAMKMEVDISTSVAGHVAAVLVQPGANVAAHQPLMRIE